MSLKRGHAAYTRDGPTQWPLQPREGDMSVGTARFPANRSIAAAKSKTRVRETAKAGDDSGSDSDITLDKSVRTRKKGEPVKSACVQCQKRKTKCSGQRPVCRFCSDRDLKCSWEITDGMTRTADLKQKLQDATGKSEDLDLLVDALRSSNDMDSTMLLARLRLGTSVEDLAKSLRLDSPSTDSTGSPSEVACSQAIDLADRRPSDGQSSASSTNLARTSSGASLYSEQAVFNQLRAASTRDHQPESPGAFPIRDSDRYRPLWDLDRHVTHASRDLVRPRDGGRSRQQQYAWRRASDATSLTLSPTSTHPDWYSTAR